MIERLEWLLWAPWRLWRKLTGARYWEQLAITEQRRADALDSLIDWMEKRSEADQSIKEAEQ